jgi:molybdate transport system substrate-binding protein
VTVLQRSHGAADVRSMTQRSAWLCVGALLLALAGCGQQAAPPTILAAASLAEVVAAVVSEVEPETRCSFSGSGTAARQIAAGAPADLLLVAESSWLAVAGPRLGPGVVIAGNRLVLIAPDDSPLLVALDGPAPSVARVAIADPASVPAGRYAQEALHGLGWWQAWQPRLIPTGDVRMALRLVASGEADLGLVYASDAGASTGVRMLAEIPEQLHQPIRYHAAVVDGSAAGTRLLAALRGPLGTAALERHGLLPMLAADAEP